MRVLLEDIRNIRHNKLQTSLTAVAKRKTGMLEGSDEGVVESPVAVDNIGSVEMNFFRNILCKTLDSIRELEPSGVRRTVGGEQNDYGGAPPGDALAAGEPPEQAAAPQRPRFRRLRR